MRMRMDDRYQVRQFLGIIPAPSGRGFFNVYNSGRSGWVLLRAALPLPGWTVANCPPGAVTETGLEFT